MPLLIFFGFSFATKLKSAISWVSTFVNSEKNQEIEDSQIEKADNSETNNQLDLTETEDLPQNKVDNELIVSLEEAKQILILVQEFLPTNPTEFDIVTLTTLIQKNDFEVNGG